MTFFPNPTEPPDPVLLMFDRRLRRLRMVWLVLFTGTVLFAFLTVVPVVIFLPDLGYLCSIVLTTCVILGVILWFRFTAIENAAHARWEQLRRDITAHD